MESPVLIHRERVHPHQQSCKAMRGYRPQDESMGKFEAREVYNYLNLDSFAGGIYMDNQPESMTSHD